MDAELKKIAERFSKDSIVTRALARLVTQIMEEIHETQIKPRDKRIAYLEDICRNLGSPEHAINRKP